MAKSRVPTWVWVIVAIAALAVLSVITLAAAGLWFVRSLQPERVDVLFT